MKSNNRPGEDAVRERISVALAGVKKTWMLAGSHLGKNLGHLEEPNPDGGGSQPNGRRLLQRGRARVCRTGFAERLGARAARVNLKEWEEGSRWQSTSIQSGS